MNDIESPVNQLGRRLIDYLMSQLREKLVIDHLLLSSVAYSAKSAIAQDERLATSPKSATRLHLSQAHKTDVVILTAETAGSLVGRISHPRRSHGCCLARATGGSLPCGPYLLAPLTGDSDGSKGLGYSEVGLHRLGSRPIFLIPR